MESRSMIRFRLLQRSIHIAIAMAQSETAICNLATANEIFLTEQHYTDYLLFVSTPQQRLINRTSCLTAEKSIR